VYASTLNPALAAPTGHAMLVRSRPSTEVDADAVEVATFERLDPHDAVAARLVILLRQQHAVESGGDRLLIDSLHEIDRAIESDDTCAASTDVRFDDDRKLQPFRCLRQRIDVRDDACLRCADLQPRQKRNLLRLARLDPKRIRAVEDVDAVRLEPGEIVVRREDRPAPPAPPRGWAHAIERRRDERRLVCRIESVAIGVNTHIRRSSAIELREERPEPVGMFVKDQKGSREAHSCISFLGARRDGTG
jgi:hypothetical protein